MFSFCYFLQKYFIVFASRWSAHRYTPSPKKSHFIPPAWLLYLYIYIPPALVSPSRTHAFCVHAVQPTRIYLYNKIFPCVLVACVLYMYLYTTILSPPALVAQFRARIFCGVRMLRVCCTLCVCSCVLVRMLFI